MQGCAHFARVDVAQVQRGFVEDVQGPLQQGRLGCRQCSAKVPGLWMCLQCCEINCGRNDSQHAVGHWEADKAHAVVINVTTRMLWCYACDEEIVASTEEEPTATDVKIDRLRKMLEATPAGSKTAASDEDSDSDSGADDAASDNDGDDGEEEGPEGLVGLSNLGNTCFMNAAIQAMANVPQLSLYFAQCEPLRDQAVAPFAHSFRRLARALWAGEHQAVRPSHVYRGLIRLNTSFAGYGQHDSHEAIRFMLNAIHEQLAVKVSHRHEPGRLPPPPAASDAPRNAATTGGATRDGTVAAAAARPATGAGAGAGAGASATEAKPTAADVAGAPKERRTSAVELRTADMLESKPHASGNGGAAERKDGDGGVVEQKGGQDGDGGAVERKGGEVEDSSDSDEASGKTVRPYESSIISDLFQGVLESRVKCLACNAVSTTRDRFFDLQLSIPPRPLTVPPDGSSQQRGWLSSLVCSVGRWIRGGDIRLEDCLQQFCQRERLTGSDRYYCEKCKARQDADKQFAIVKLPDVLCIALKRFRHDSMWTSKVSTPVAFPTEGLDMAPFVRANDTFDTSRCQYDLCSIVRHIGGMGGGHYVAYGKNRRSGRWHKFDDSYVTRTSSRRVRGQEAYILFFRRRFQDRTPHILSIQAQLSAGPHVAFVSKHWWMLWTCHAHPGPPRVSELACPHGNVKVTLGDAIDDLVVPLSQVAVDALRAEFGSRAQLLPSLSPCPTCLREAKALQQQRVTEKDSVYSKDAVNEVEAVADEGPHAAPWFIISAAWLADWSKFINDSAPVHDGTGRGTPRPGPVDNSGLVDEDGVPVAGRLRVRHYRGVNKLVWEELIRLYGGGPVIRRQAIDLYGPGEVDAGAGEADAGAGEADAGAGHDESGEADASAGEADADGSYHSRSDDEVDSSATT